jgi:hypothetical protein
MRILQTTMVEITGIYGPELYQSRLEPYMAVVCKMNIQFFLLNRSAYGEQMINFKRAEDYQVKRYESWKAEVTFGRKEWLTRAEDSEELYLNDVDNRGNTFTGAQQTAIENGANIPVSINFLYPVANQSLAILNQMKPSNKVVSLDGRAKDEAFVLEKMKTGIFNTTNARIEIENHIKDMIISGQGHLMTLPGDFYQPGLFGLQVVHVPYDEVILDINAKKRDLSDMEGFFIEKQFTVPKALQLYGHIIAELKGPDGRPVDISWFTGETWIEQDMTDKAKVTTGNWNADDRVQVREYYEKAYTTMYAVPNSETGLLEFFFAENLPEDGRTLLAGAEQEIPDIYIRKTIILGDWQIWSEMLPINDYPLVTSFFEWGGRPYRSYGMIHFTKDMQRAFDKIMQTMILNGILSNNAGWTVPKGSIAEEDRSKWEQYGNNPQVLKEYVAQEINGVLLRPEKEQVSQLSNFYPMMLEMLKQGIEYSTGVSAILQGDASAAGVDVFSSLQQYQNAAMQRILLSQNHINDTMKNLGEVIVQYLVVNIKPDTFEFFDESGHLNELQVALGLANKVKQSRYQVIAIPATYMPSQRLATATELMKIAQSSPDPAERSLLTQKAMELSDVQEYDQIQEKLDIVKRTEAKHAKLVEAYERLMETSKQMENKYINISLENRILKKLANAEQKLTEAGVKAEASVKIDAEKKKAANKAPTASK